MTVILVNCESVYNMINEQRIEKIEHAYVAVLEEEGAAL